MKDLLRAAILLTGLTCVSAEVSAGIVIAENTGGTTANLAGYFGQSFLTAAGGPFVGITFNFFSDTPATTPVAFGTGYLFTAPYIGTPGQLSTSSFLAKSTGISGGKYVFDPTLVLQSNTTYYFYEDALVPTAAITGGNVYAGGGDAFTTDANTSFSGINSISTNFAVESVAVPEPGTLASGALAALVSLGGLWCRRRTARVS